MKEGGKYILGALGIPKKTGDSYQETRYRLGDKLSQPTPLFMRALVEFFPDYHPVFLVTPKAEEAGWVLVEEIFGYSPEKIRVPDGRSENELWELIKEVLGEVKPNTQLILDITHGFRSMPLLTLQAGLLLKEMQTAKITGVYYGAFEARSAEATPVFDLSPLLDLNDWTQALAILARLGKAGPLTERLDAVAVPVFKKERSLPRQPAGLRRLSETLKALNDALHTLRPQEVFENAKKLAELLPQAENELEFFPELRALVPYLQPSFNRLATLAPTQPGAFSGIAGLETLARMIHFYLDTEAYVKAITVSREALVSFVLLEEGNDHTAQDARESAEKKLNQWAREGLAPKELHPAVDIWRDLRDLRNDVNHAGFRAHPRRAKTLAREARKLGEATARLILERLAKSA